MRGLLCSSEGSSFTVACITSGDATEDGDAGFAAPAGGFSTLAVATAAADAGAGGFTAPDGDGAADGADDVGVGVVVNNVAAAGFIESDAGDGAAVAAAGFGLF